MKRYFIMGNAYEAEGPIDFWRKWNPDMHNGLYKLYRKLGGINKPLIASYTPFLVSGLWHDVLFQILRKVINFKAFDIDIGFWTLSFALFGIPVVADKYLIIYKAKKKLGNELDLLIKKYGIQSPQKILANFSPNLVNKRVSELKNYFLNYKGNKRKIIGELFKDTNWGVLSVMKERKMKKGNSKILKLVKILLTWVYVIGILLLVEFILPLK